MRRNKPPQNVTISASLADNAGQEKQTQVYAEFRTREHVKFKSRQDGSKVLSQGSSTLWGGWWEEGRRGFLAAPVEKTVSGLPGMTLEGPGCLRMGRGYQEGSVQCPQPQFAVCDVSRQALHSLRGGF